jgi:hypothetical protein
LVLSATAARYQSAPAQSADIPPPPRDPVYSDQISVAIHRLANDRECLVQQLRRTLFAGREQPAHFFRSFSQFIIGELPNMIFKRINFVDGPAISLEQPLIAASEYFDQYFADTESHDATPGEFNYRLRSFCIAGDFARRSARNWAG